MQLNESRELMSASVAASKTPAASTSSALSGPSRDPMTASIVATPVSGKASSVVAGPEMDMLQCEHVCIIGSIRNIFWRLRFDDFLKKDLSAHYVQNNYTMQAILYNFMYLYAIFTYCVVYRVVIFPTYCVNAWGRFALLHIDQNWVWLEPVVRMLPICDFGSGGVIRKSTSTRLGAVDR